MPNNTQITCDTERIEAFLQQQLSAEEQSSFEAHLDECQNCRERLEASAASDELWAGVRESLSAEPLSAKLSDSVANDQAEFSYQTILDWLAPTDDDRMLGRLDGYEVMGVVGSGGMGVVLKALDPALNRYVAVKVLAPYLGSSGSARKRFLREAQASAAVIHENVIEIHGVSKKDGLPYLVMPYVSGPSLQRRLDHEGPLDLAEILRIGRQAATGLAAAHAQGLVHRDVKPANILLAEGVERVKLTDFGLARAADDASLTKSGVIAGTPQYMSPEQARGETIDQRSDLFSLGSVLYAMCTGRAPFRAETSYGVLRRITDDEPRPVREINPDIPEWLCQIIDRLMSKEPDDRFQSAQEVAELLEQCLAHVQQPTVVPLAESLVTQPNASSFSIFRRPRLITALGLVGIGLLAFLFWQATEPPDISGKWKGKQWGNVTLKQVKLGKYEGSYTDVFQSSYKNPHPEKWGDNCMICHRGSDHTLGKIELKWSRLDRRYRGTWAQGKQRFGRISVEVVDGEIRGFWDVNKKSRINPGIPEREAPLVWVRPENSAAAEQVPGFRVVLHLNAESHSLDLMKKNEGFNGLSIYASGLKGTIDGKEFDNLTAVIAHHCRLEDFKETSVNGKKYWEATFFVPQGTNSHGSNQLVTQQRIDELTKQGVEFQFDHYRDRIPWRFAPPDSDSNEGDSDRADVEVPDSIPKGAWGESNNGLRIALVADPDTVKLGEIIPLKVIVENASKKSIRFSASDLLNKVRMDVRDTSRNQAATSQVWSTGIPARKQFELRPGQQVVVSQPGLMVVENKDDGEPLPGLTKVILSRDKILHNNILIIQCSIKLADQQKGEWSGSLTSGQIAVNAYRETREKSGADEDSGEAEAVQSNTSTFLEQYKRLIERRRYEQAALLTLDAMKHASNEDVRQLWEMRSKFANQLVKARDNSDEERKLLKLMDISLQRITDSYDPHTNSPPQSIAVVRAVEQSENVPENSLTDLFKRHPDNFRIVVEPIYDKVEEPQFYPMVGVSRLHRLRFKCTLFFIESDDLKWPGPDQGQGRIEKTTYIDHDHLIAVARESIRSQHSDSEQPSSKLQNEDVPEASVPVFGRREENEPDHELQFLLLWPRGSKMASRDGRAELELPGRMRMRGNSISFSLTDLPDFAKNTLYGSIHRMPVNEKTRQFLKEHAISLELNEGDLQMASRGTLMQYIFLPHQQPGEKWAGQFGVLRMGPVNAKSDEAVRKNLKERGELLVVLQLNNHQPDEKADSYELAPASDDGTEPGPGTPPNSSSSSQRSFDCMIVDSKTGDPIPGEDFTIGLVFEIPKTETHPWQLVEQVLLGPGHLGKFQFEIPEKVLKHPDRDLIQVRWFVMHRKWEQFGGYDPPRVNELINNDPRTARDGLKQITLRPTNANSAQPERFDEFNARLFILDHLGLQQVSWDPLRQLYQGLLEQFPEHPDRAAAMLAIASVWGSTIPAEGVEADDDQVIIWLRQAANASRQGTPLWYKTRFYLQARLHQTDRDEAEAILTTILQSRPDPVNEVKAWNQRVTLALVYQGDEELGEKICRQLHDRMSNKKTSRKTWPNLAIITARSSPAPTPCSITGFSGAMPPGKRAKRKSKRSEKTIRFGTWSGTSSNMQNCRELALAQNKRFLKETF